MNIEAPISALVCVQICGVRVCVIWGMLTLAVTVYHHSGGQHKLWTHQEHHYQQPAMLYQLYWETVGASQIIDSEGAQRNYQPISVYVWGCVMCVGYLPLWPVVIWDRGAIVRAEHTPVPAWCGLEVVYTTLYIWYKEWYYNMTIQYVGKGYSSHTSTHLASHTSTHLHTPNLTHPASHRYPIIDTPPQ